MTPFDMHKPLFHRHPLKAALPLVLALFFTAAALLFQPLSTGAAPVATERYITINFNDVDIDVFIRFISEVTGTNFVVDDKIRGKVTIISPNKISIKEAFKVFESVLDVHGFTAVKSGDVTKIIPLPEARTKNVATLLKQSAASAEDRVVTQLVQLDYADPAHLQKLLTPLISKNSVILAYEPSSTVIITDVQSNISRLLKIIQAIDVPATGNEITVYPLERSDPKKIVAVLDAMFQASRNNKKSGASGKALEFIAHERTNSVVFLASESATDRIKKLIGILDRETPEGDGNVRVYYLEHARAEDMVDVLKAVPKKDKAGADKTSEAPAVSKNVTIAADKATNSIVVMGEKSDYALLESIIKKLDIPRAMVYIEALIIEVKVDKDFQLGTEWVVGGETVIGGKSIVYGGGSGSGGSYGNALSNTNFPNGLALGVFGEGITVGSVTFPSLAAVVKAFQQDKDVHILSTPQVLTTDNEEAKITVAQNVPYQTSTSISTTSTTGSFEYRDVGIVLKITPQISKDSMVRLVIELETNKIDELATQAVTTDERLTPTTFKRTVQTTVIVKDNNTVVIGGLIDDAFTSTLKKVPGLGDIPLIGWLFRSGSDASEKTNLFVFLTPRVVKTDASAVALLKEKTDEVERFEPGTIRLYQSRENNTKVEQVSQDDRPKKTDSE